MYEEYYGFSEKPFSLTPDPKYLYKSESHGSALELLQYAIRRREGFVVITGDIGTGKTTLCRALLEKIDRNTFTALVLNPFLSEEDLLKLILQDFGCVSREQVKQGRLNNISKQELIDTLYDFLLGLLPLRSGAVLIIDEAQNLPLKVLEQLRILSNLETDKEKLLQIILVGQLNLVPLLKSPELRQLDQRVSIRYELKPLNREELASYVSHRLMVAGGATAVSFMPKALDQIHRFSNGIPRLINLICDRSLLGAYALHTNKVTREIVRKAAETLDVPKPARRARFGWFRARAVTRVMAVVLTVLAALLVVLFGPTPFTETARAGLVAPQSVSVRPEAQANPLLAQSMATAIMPAPCASSAAIEQVQVPLPGDRPYTLFVASFPIEASGESRPVSTVTNRLQALGYPVYSVDVDLGQRGRWRRVLAGAYRTLNEARETETRLKSFPEFGSARVITSTFATSTQLARAEGVS